MIKATELRIDNYVVRNDIPGNWYKVRAICKDRVHPINVVEQDWVKNCFYASECTLMELEPIPLTAELLEKCGFEKDGIYPDGKSFVFNGKYYLTGTWFKVHTSCGTFKVLNENIEYLHQLQNLIFALTGKELEIKL